MGKWEAVVRIVEAFIGSGKPGYALLALTVMTITSLALVLALLAAGARFHGDFPGSESRLAKAPQATRLPNHP